MRILVDGDAVPGAVKEILFRAAVRTGTPLVLVANQKIAVPASELISSLVVPAGPDEADNKIVELAGKGDLVITADIPLADRVVSKDAYCIGPRGGLYSVENIKERLAMRDLMSDLRDSGLDTPGPSPFKARDRQNFANQLDRFLAKQGKNREE